MILLVEFVVYFVLKVKSHAFFFFLFFLCACMCMFVYKILLKTITVTKLGQEKLKGTTITILIYKKFI